MAGREDYEERKENRIDRLNSASNKASKESYSQTKRSHDLIKNIPLGQPNIRGALTGVMNKSKKAMDSAIELSDKADYYAARADSAENNHTISSDDPNVIEKLQEKLENLEAQREQIKEKNKELKKAGKEVQPAWVLTNLGATIRNTKERIAQVENVNQMPSEIIEFDGGEIVSDATINRVQIKFYERQNDETTEKLKRNGFKWAPSEQAWQRLRNQISWRTAKRIVGI